MMERVGIAGRTAALLILVAALVSGAAGWLLYRSEEKAERALLEDRAKTFSRALSGSLREAMQEHRPDSMQAILEAVVRTEGVVGAAIAGGTGAVRHGTGEYPARLALGQSEAPVWSGQRLTLTRPIANEVSCWRCHGTEAKWNGALHVNLNVSSLGPRLGRMAARMALLVALAIIATSIVVVLVLRATLARPLGRLRSFAEALGRGDLDARPPPAPGPEAGALTRALTYMAEEIQRSHRELEARVDERTAKLAEALAAANAAREERTAALTRLQAIIDSMADGVIFVDAQDRVAIVNNAGRVLRNLSDGPGKAVRDCHPAGHLATFDRVMAYLRQGDDAGPPHSIIKEREGRYETAYAPVRAPGGEYLGIVMVIRDIAERRNLERRLLDTERLAGLGQMSAQLAHELRNPLNVIDGAAQYLRRSLPEHAEVAEYSSLIGEEVQRVNRFIGELLHVARPAEPVFQASAVNKLVKEAAQRAALARGDPAAPPALHLAAGLPVLDLDHPMMLAALVNLLDNAFEAGGPAVPEVETRFEGSGGEGQVVIEIRDRGCGIPPEQLEEVTRPFVTTKPAGTGLGLVVVMRAVEQHRARFQLSGREGGGTVATLRFPVRTIRAQPSAERATA